MYPQRQNVFFYPTVGALLPPQTWLHVLKPKRPPPPPPTNSPLRVSYSLSLICQPHIRGHEAPHPHHLIILAKHNMYIFRVSPYLNLQNNTVKNWDVGHYLLLVELSPSIPTLPLCLPTLLTIFLTFPCANKQGCCTHLGQTDPPPFWRSGPGSLQWESLCPPVTFSKTLVIHTIHTLVTQTNLSVTHNNKVSVMQSINMSVTHIIMSVTHINLSVKASKCRSNTRSTHSQPHQHASHTPHQHTSHIIIIIMYIYHVLISALSTHMIHTNLNIMFYTHVEHGLTKTIYIKYYMEKKNTHTLHTHTWL